MRSDQAGVPRAAAMLVAAVAAIGLMSVAVLAGCSDSGGSSAAATDPAVAAASNEMATAVRDRLAVMPDVAWTKYEQKTPVDDPARDAAVTASFVKSATAQQIPADVASAVIAAQIESAKRVQRSLIQQWGTGVTPIPTSQPLNIDKDLRPKIDAATNQLLHGMVTFLALTPPTDWPAALTASAKVITTTLPPGVTDTDFDLALIPLGEWRKGGVTATPTLAPKPTPKKKKPVPTDGQ